jgi:membrane-bound lytic murein transglycosylase D
MPTELALLPMVESSYNPLAYSRAHASGLWQFIPSTGRLYNLTQDKWVDERRDVVASTAAALDYLQALYEMHGDWQLALASYNWGENAVARAIQRNLDEGLPAEYSDLRMPEETRNYVPKLQALKNIVAQPELFHFELPYVDNAQHFTTVEVGTAIDLATAAKLAGMPLDEFMALNPAFNRPVIAFDGQTLVVPVDKADAFESRLAQLHQSGNRWRSYELKRGERLAAVAKRFGLSLAQLRQLNGLGPRSRVGAGYALLVPDGVDPSGALVAARLLQQPASADAAPPAKEKERVSKASQAGTKIAKKATRAPNDAANSKNAKGGKGGKAKTGAKTAKTAKTDGAEKTAKTDRAGKSDKGGKTAKGATTAKAARAKAGTTTKGDKAAASHKTGKSDKKTARSASAAK